MQNNYRQTLAACCIGFITQAVSANFVPLLFIRFQTEFHLDMRQLALIPTVLFVTQIGIDAFCAWFVDRLGYRRCVVLSQIASAAGLAGLAFMPGLFSNPFEGILVCVFLYAIGSGLTEVLVSPIVEACPFEHKDTVMSLLHSFYCWGSVGVIVLSSLFFILFDVAHWRTLACIWAVLPLVNIFNFTVCPIQTLTEQGEGMTIRQLFSCRMFYLALGLMVCAGACELAMAQ